MIILRNDTSDDVNYKWRGAEFTIDPGKTASFDSSVFENLQLENVIVKIKHNVIKIKGVM